MNEKQIKQLAKEGFFGFEPINGTLEQTHISWVILSNKHAFKIKKPVKLSFLDFSTLTNRKKLCNRELLLNKRFSSIYESVAPVRYGNNYWKIGDGVEKIVDYAVVMKRLDPAKRMDKLLIKNKVPESSVVALAKDIARFHLNAPIIRSSFISSDASSTFNDILSISGFVSDYLGKKFAGVIDNSIEWSGRMLCEHKQRIEDRISLGFRRDVHGDLHAGNIFAYKRPVIFDCIEFNDSYRQIDVLSEIAFLCMDFESFKKLHLAETFLAVYKSTFDCLQQEDYILFNYYKCLRANIRAKVHAINCGQAKTKEAARFHLERLKIYLVLMEGYINLY